MKDLLGIATEAGGVTLDVEHATQSAETGLVIDNILIEGDRWGSSGYYPATVLEKDGARAFPAGTQVFLDHAEIGKDSAKGLIGELQEDARYVLEDDGKKVLRAPMKFYESGTYNATWIKERAKRLGVSIRSGVTFAAGTAAGRTGKIVTSFTEGISVDVVARAGAGGKFGTIKESADPLQMQENPEERHTVTPEEIKAMATAISESLKPSLDAVTTALGEVKTSVEESARSANSLTPQQVSADLAKAKLPTAAESRVWSVFEAKGNVEAAIESEKAQWTEAVAEAKKGLADGGHFVEESAEDKAKREQGESASESYIPSGWAVSE